MKKVLHKILKVLVVIILIVTILLFILFIYHKIMLKIEGKKLIAPGQKVSIYDTNYHVYMEGKGDKTIIFLSGWGVTSPVYEYKEIYSKLSDEYRIVVIEKPGNGYASSTNRKRNLNNILEEYKMILNELNIEGPYILMAHSAGGIETLYWLQKYPKDIEAIISLDMTIPEQSIYASNMRKEHKVSYALSDFIYLFGSTTGLTRLSFVSNMFIEKGQLNEYEYNQNKLLFYKNAYSKNSREEEIGVFLAGKEIDENKINYDVPYIEFVSGTVMQIDAIYDMHMDFINKFNNHKKIELSDATHTMYRTHSENIAKEIKEYLNLSVSSNVN